MALVKIVDNTTTKTVAPKVQSPGFNTHSDTYSIEEAVGRISVPRRSIKVNEFWHDFAIYQEHVKKEQVKAVSKTLAIFSTSLGKWKSDTAFSSSLTEILMHPGYQRIIGLGQDAVPFILRELADHGGQWYWALQAISGENPVPEEDQGRPRQMTAAWVQWGKERNFL